MSLRRSGSKSPRSKKDSLDESFEITYASGDESGDESSEKRNVYLSPSGSKVVRVHAVEDSGAESDSEVTAEIMDVTKSITQQIMESSIKDKHEV